jgi:hypothetical protein
MMIESPIAAPKAATYALSPADKARARETADAPMPVPAPAPTSAPRPPAENVAKIPVDPEEAKQGAYEKRLELSQRLLGSDKSLIIERNSDNYGFIYKTINRDTGEVLRVWPRQDALKTLQTRTDCAACDAVSGAMIDAKV